MSSSPSADTLVINQLKGLVIDGVNKAQSGHPGGAMSSMDFAYILFSEFLNFNPKDPTWAGRDRFVLSAGHESMLMYSLLYFCGWLKEEDLRQFRQLHSRTPGHVENFVTPGVEATTGPLGQGAAMSVGMAVAGQHLNAVFNKEGFAPFESKIISLCGDGDFQEDVCRGAAALAGHWGLANLIWYYDKNRCQISGTLDRVSSDDEGKIFEAMGWSVIRIDGHDHTAIREALKQAYAEKERPTLIVGQTIMAHGSSSMEGDHNTHGAPLPANERLATKKKLGLPEDKDFFVSDEALKHFRRMYSQKEDKVLSWEKAFSQAKERDSFKNQWEKYFALVDLKKLPEIKWAAGKELATRNAFGEVLESWIAPLPNLIGGSADLEPSNMTEGYAKKVGDFGRKNKLGRNLAFGVREFPMSAICNGIALFGGLIPFDATFLTFSDYSRPALRLGAIQKLRVIHEFSHDSFHLGEDGPTHQPIEHIMSLRAMPDIYVMRPADAIETQVMMQSALKLSAPTILCLSRQKLPVLSLTEEQKNNIEKGAYIVYQTREQADHIIFATGSEVSLAMGVAKKLEADKKASVTVVSMPCWELFEKQDESYKKKILNWSCQKRISIEAGATLGWQKYVGAHGIMIGLDRFGDSAPASALAQEYGFTVDQIVQKI